MNKDRIIWSFIALLLVFGGGACSDDDEPGREEGREELKPVVLPGNLSVAEISDMTAILVWEGEATEYEVEFNDQTLPTQSISYGLKDLVPQTIYSWRVRSREGKRYSEWVKGPDFTTLQTVDYTGGWPGVWKASDFKLEIASQGVSIPVDMFIPDDILNRNIGVTIKKKEGTADRILLDCPDLETILPVPLTMDVGVKDDEISFIRVLDASIKAPIKEPIKISDLPFISEIPALSDLLKDAKITEMSIVLQNMSVYARLIEEKIPFDLSITGKFQIMTDDEAVNMLLSLIPVSVSINAGMTLTPQE